MNYQPYVFSSKLFLSFNLYDIIKLSLGQFSFIVLLKYSNGYDGNRCGGTIISKLHVLTAAHCFDRHKTKPEDWTLMAGTVSNIATKKNTYEIKKITIHPGYIAKAALNDIAILTMQKKFQLDENLSSLELASSFNLPKSTK